MQNWPKVILYVVLGVVGLVLFRAIFGAFGINMGPVDRLLDGLIGIVEAVRNWAK